MGKPPKVFISYSHDSERHVNEVVSLAERLREDGINAVVDQYLNGSPPEGWPRWMLNQLDDADFVLVVCSEVYYRRFRGSEQPGIGKGANWEASLITQEIYDNRNHTNKFVPVFIDRKTEQWIPDPLRSKTIYEITSQASYDELYDFLLGQAGYEPGALGPLKARARTQVGRLTFPDTPQESTISETAAEEEVVNKPSFREILIGRWHILIRPPFPTGPMGQMNLDLFAGFASVVKIPWPPVFDGNLLSVVETVDFAIVDIGNESMESGLIGYLHGKCIPCIRLMKGYIDKNIVNKRTNLRGFFGIIPVGYPKDIILWKNADALAYELNLRLEFIRSPVKRINTKNEAIQYFQKAKQRNDTIFLSYSGKDRQIASLISAELKKRFQRVFDYKDGESITPGEPWINEIFDKLSGSKLGIPLVTASYLESGNCVHEAQEMIALRDSNKISVIPLKLYEEKIETPSWMRSRHFVFEGQEVLQE